MKAVAVRRKGSCARQAGKTVFTGILYRKRTLIDVGHPFSAWFELVAPGIQLAGFASARGEFPFSFGGETFSSPLCIRLGVRVGNVHRRIFFAPFDVAVRTFRMPPIGAF